VESARWGISLRKGHHEPLISAETYRKIQERLVEGAKVPARKDISLDFPCADLSSVAIVERR
jgi:hypothetical protein